LKTDIGGRAEAVVLDVILPGVHKVDRCADGLGDLDHGGLIRYYEKQAKVEVKR